jgi:hypothetical protein
MAFACLVEGTALLSAHSEAEHDTALPETHSKTIKYPFKIYEVTDADNSKIRPYIPSDEIKA